MITGIVIAAVLVGGVGLFIGVFLGLAGKKFAVEVDEKEVAIIQFFRSLSNEQKETFCDFLITLKQFLNDEKS